MPFLGPSMGQTFQGSLSGKGFNGPQLTQFTTACGLGTQLSIVGKTFSTTDTGLTAGGGSGSGVGLTIPASIVSSTIMSRMSGFGFTGPRISDLAQSYAEALVSESSKATLSSTHTPVYSGVGNVDLGSIPVVDSEWGNKITTQGQGQGFKGPQWPQVALALAAGGVAGYALATGTVTISGGGTPGIPGGGSGSGTIS